MSSPCAAPDTFEALIAYYLRELPEADAERVEEHYFACATYSTTPSDSYAAVAEGIRGTGGHTGV